MKNITLKIDNETHRKARIRAPSEGTSVSAMVRDFLIRATRQGAAGAAQNPDRPRAVVATRETPSSAVNIVHTRSVQGARRVSFIPKLLSKFLS